MKAEEEARRRAEEEEKARLAEEERKRKEAEKAAALEAKRAEAERKAAEKRAQLEAEREAARIRKEERERKAAEEKAKREAEKQARKDAKEEARRKAAAEKAAPVLTERKHATTDEAVVEQLGQGRKIETRGDQHAVYVYQDEHKDFAFLVSDEDKKLQASIERMGIAIRAYMASSTNEQRNPVRRADVKDHIARLQNRWRG